jgi:hypothetical protein
MNNFKSKDIHKISRNAPRRDYVNLSVFKPKPTPKHWDGAVISKRFPSTPNFSTVLVGS